MLDKRWVTLLIGATLGLTGCGGGSSSDNTTGGAFNASFPQGLAVASPVDVNTGSVTISSAGGKKKIKAAGSTTVPSYQWATDQINDLLTGALSVASTFDPQVFRTQPRTASCFGPTLKYSDHPDGAVPNSGELPSGDLGIWVETDSVSGDACAAAQLNARMNSISAQAQAALVGLASLITVADASSIAAPTAGDTVDLTSQMNAAGIADTTFTAASVSLNGAGTVWSYELAFTYAPSGITYPSGVSALDMKVWLQHAPGATANEYKGRMSYQVEDVMTGGTCPLSDPSDATNPVTLVGSLLYERGSATELNVQLKTGQFCGHDLATTTGFDSDGLADGSDTYDAASNPYGWGNNFVVFGAKYDPQTLKGDYSFAWQAGPMDSHSRIFNVGINYDSTNDRLDGEAYFGYGATVGTTDGRIQGMICNWAGPGSSHTLQEYAQREFISYDAASERFTVASGGADITYAPTNSCTYDTAASSGSFLYDRDLDSDLSDESVTTVDVTDPVGAGLAFDLFPASTSTYAGMAIEDAIAARGYTVPTPPTPTIP